jgi:hypothetical protein
MTEDETFKASRWYLDLELVWPGLFMAALSCFSWAAVLSVADSSQGAYFASGRSILLWGGACFVSGASILVCASLGLDYMKATKSATLKTDTLRLDEREIPYKDIVQARFVEGPKGGKSLQVKTKDETIDVWVRHDQRLVDSLSERMEANGIRIKTKRMWFSKNIEEIINLDAKKP